MVFGLLDENLFRAYHRLVEIVFYSLPPASDPWQYSKNRPQFKVIWLAKPKGRPPIHENIVDLIIEMKRCNQSWGAQRLSEEFQLLGIKISRKSVLKILRVNGFLPPQTRFTPPSWCSVLDSFRRYWAMDFTTVFDSKGIQIFIFAIIEVPSRKLILINSTANPTREWILQQFRYSCISGHQFPEAMVHDREGIFGHWLPKNSGAVWLPVN